MDTAHDILHKYLQGKSGGLPASVFEEILAPDYAEHQPSIVRGVKEAKEFAAILLKAFPKQHFGVKDELAQGKSVAFRYDWHAVHSGDFMKWPATNKEVSTHGIIIARVRDNRIAESWEEWDFAGFVNQLGNS